jgi:lipoprotein NlpD
MFESRPGLARWCWLHCHWPAGRLQLSSTRPPAPGGGPWAPAAASQHRRWLRPTRSRYPGPGGSQTAVPGAENAGKPGYYTVKPGDTLIRIGLDHGQNWRDLVRWNTLENPNVH